MLLSPYHTIHGSAVQYKKLEPMLRREIIERSDGIVQVEVEDGLPLTYSLTKSDDIPIFNQCLQIEHNKQTYVISDDRQANHSPRERLLNDLNLRFTSIWMNGNSSMLQQSTILAGRVFTNIVTNAVIQRYGLSMQELAYIKTAAAIYYNSMHHDEEPESYKLIRSIKNYTGLASTDVEKHIDSGGGYITSVSGLANAIVKSGNPALRSFNDVALMTILSGIYYGLNSKEHIAISLEYPPRWVSMVALVMQDAGFNKTILGSTTKKLMQRDDTMLDYIKYILE